MRLVKTQRTLEAVLGSAGKDEEVAVGHEAAVPVAVVADVHYLARSQPPLRRLSGGLERAVAESAVRGSG